MSAGRVKAVRHKTTQNHQPRLFWGNPRGKEEAEPRAPGAMGSVLHQLMGPDTAPNSPTCPPPA